MKQTIISLFVPAFFFTLLFTSCNAGKLNREAEKTSNAFYTSLQQKDYTAALTLCSDKAFSKETKDQWNHAFKKNAALLGNLISFKQTSSFNIETSTSVGTTVRMAFEVEWQYGKSTDSVFLIKEKDGSMKIYHYSWQHSHTQYLDAINESEMQAAKYVDAIRAADYGTAIGFCSEEALKATPKEKWAAFLTSAGNQYGNIEDYRIISDSSSYNIEANGEGGKGNYYDVFVRSKRGGKMIMEKIVFFQKSYEVPVRLTGHYFL